MSLFAENAEILKGMKEGGSDLAPSRTVDFNHVFADRASAEMFAADVTQNGFKAVVEAVSREEDPWDVTASTEMVPSAENVTTTEESLDALARAQGGRSDGWGFMEV